MALPQLRCMCLGGHHSTSLLPPVQATSLVPLNLLGEVLSPSWGTLSCLPEHLTQQLRLCVLGLPAVPRVACDPLGIPPVLGRHSREQKLGDGVE